VWEGSRGRGEDCGEYGREGRMKGREGGKEGGRAGGLTLQQQ